MRRLHAGHEADVGAQLEAVGHMVGVLQDFGLGGETLAPVPLLLQVFRELVGILHALDVASRAGVAVPVPGAAHTIAGFEDSGLEPEFARGVQHVHAGKPGPHDDDVEGDIHFGIARCGGLGELGQNGCAHEKVSLGYRLI